MDFTFNHNAGIVSWKKYDIICHCALSIPEEEDGAEGIWGTAASISFAIDDGVAVVAAIPEQDVEGMDGGGVGSDLIPVVGPPPVPPAPGGPPEASVTELIFGPPGWLGPAFDGRRGCQRRTLLQPNPSCQDGDPKRPN